MKAIIADIHGNLSALHAVLADIAACNVSDIYCLGDIVGYGPNPRECVDLLLDCRVALLGNHDLAATGGQTLATISMGKVVKSTAWVIFQMDNVSGMSNSGGGAAGQ